MLLQFFLNYDVGFFLIFHLRSLFEMSAAVDLKLDLIIFDELKVLGKS